MDRTAGQRRSALPPWLAVGAVLAVIALANLTQAQASTGEAPPSEPAARSISTVLQPGWNTVAWLGLEAPVTDFFDAVPPLQRVYAWDVAEQRFRGGSRNSGPLDGLRRLTTGMGLLVHVGGDAPFEWTRTASAESVLLSLREGLNLVGWAGRDGMPVEDALARFGDLLVAAWGWDEEAGAYELYWPGPPAASRTPSTLDRGDALWVQVRGHGLWWQWERGPSTVVFADDVPEEQQAEIRGWASEPPAVARGQLAGHLPVSGGVGLVVWGGGPAADLVAAMRTRGCNVAQVRVTDPRGAGQIRYLPTRLKEPNVDFTGAFPEELPALIPAMVACAGPDTPRVAFIGDVPSDLRSVFRAEVESVIEFFSGRYGVSVPDFSVYIAMGVEEGIPLYRELNPGGLLLYVSAAGLAQSFFDEEIVLVFGSHDALGRDMFARIFSHEYFHLLQRHVQQKESPHWGAGPWWLLEGTAHFADELYESEMGYDAVGDHVDGLVKRLAASRKSGTHDLRELESFPGNGRDLAALGTRYLLDRYGTPSSYVRFWEGLDDVRGWRDTFADVFEVTVDEFYRDFRTHYDSLFGTISVAIDGPVPELPGAVGMSFQGGSPEQGYTYSTVIEDGRARAEVLPGSYSARAFVNVQIGGGWWTADLGNLQPRAGTTESGTIVMCQKPDEQLTVRAGEVTEASVQLPVYHMISGSVRYATGAPVPNTDGLLVALHGLSDGRCWKSVKLDSSLHFFLPNGSTFSIEVWLGPTWVGWYGSDGLTTDPEAAAKFTVDGEDLTLPDMELPAAE